VLVGGALGAINGCLVNWTGLHPFIITLGTNAIFRGITLVISDANSVYGFSFDFVNFFAATPLGIPVPVIFSLIVAVILVPDHPHARGRNIYALGGNKNSAFYSGIDVKFHMLLVFIISGIAPGWRAWSPPPVSGRRNRWPAWALKPTPSPAPSSAAPASSAVKDASSRWSSAA
jgi:D-allose transport system permease protein